MRHFILAFVVACGAFGAFDTYAAVSKCSKTNLMRCLDSACAINASMNAAARCQYCGTSAAGTPPSQKGLSNVTVGQSTKYAISDKDLSLAPSDPGKRYIWATTECIKKLPDCTPDDASSAYDKLIEQSCKAAGITTQIKNQATSLNTKPTKTKCNSTFTACIEKKCGVGFDLCETDGDFDRFVAECGADASGCDEYIAEFKKSTASARTSAIKNRDKLVQTIADGYQTTRKTKLSNAMANCTNGSAANACIKTVCENNMRGKCKDSTEKSMATQLCKFYETACTVLK
ncbi:MAG: hypothetical protein J5742_00995 [Alphaproteobacteria bacterium]|nr:hypothetical protein [Alphaproteobacteria bacterium]